MKIAFLVLLAIACAIAQDCSTLTTCSACAAAGCSYCNSYTKGAQCFPKGTTIETSECYHQGVDQADKWILPSNATQCYGGCSSAEYCTQCSSAGYVGCGWCATPGNGMNAASGCTEGTASGPNNGTCGVWVYQTCQLPCSARGTCQGCLSGMDNQNGTCAWEQDASKPTDPSVGTCTKSSTAASSAILKDGSCPAPLGGDASSISFFSALVLAMIAVFVNL
eukprot:TRINITY_DN14985_c0_g2_i1.p1 TRINITY_DN14985_c0_g2~~TRINITY_DN14985_c0_g2_i1.p1  ORF type:complete len:251 (-),score=49.23 TRINITY_DN14985_c0_g2_i1:49-714(-)